MKLKTHKTALKRFKITKGKRSLKFIKKTCGQDHFNARESSKVTRAKRRRVPISQCEVRGLKQMMPYNI
ncbi:MAG: 50S ribosomal protein L35 [Parcubacteria group bacterium]|nr:50S ribosomal protein L35 [Parcubacteria group bacterium]